MGPCGVGKLNKPIGNAVDTNGVLYVSESHNHRISLFTTDCQFITSFGEKGKGPGGLAMDESGVVFVCELQSLCTNISACVNFTAIKSSLL